MNKKINCEVEDCVHCDCDSKCCTLNKINVCNCSSEHEKEATMCDSYEGK